MEDFPLAYSFKGESSSWQEAQRLVSATHGSREEEMEVGTAVNLRAQPQ